MKLLRIVVTPLKAHLSKESAEEGGQGDVVHFGALEFDVSGALEQTARILGPSRTGKTEWTKSFFKNALELWNSCRMPCAALGAVRMML